MAGSGKKRTGGSDEFANAFRRRGGNQSVFEKATADDIYFQDDEVFFVDPTTDTKRVRIDAGGVSAATDVVLAVTDAGLSYGGVLFTNKAAFAGADVETAQNIFEAAGDTATLAAATTYLMNGLYMINTAGTAAHTTSLLFGGTATLTSIGGTYTVAEPATDVLDAALIKRFAVATAIAVTGSVSAATLVTVLVQGIVRTNAAGTFIPQYQYTGAPGAVSSVLTNSYLHLQPVGINTLQGLGVA